MSTRTYSLPFTAAGTIPLPGGVFFYVKSASAALTITTRGSTTAPIEFVNVGAGLRFGPVDIDKRWTYLDVASASAQTVEVIVSDDAEVDIASTVNVAGSVTVVELPATVVASPAPNVIANGGILSIAASASRKRIKICSDPANAGNVYIQAPGAGAGRGIPLQPGMYEEVQGTYAFDVRNNSGASCTVTQYEES
jgi:hypothetical protein